MSKKIYTFVIICILIFISNSQAKLQYTLTPEIGIMGGTTEYELDAILNDTTNGGLPAKHRITSLLEFPLDVIIAGISGEFHSLEEPKRWSITLKFLKNINHPNGKMIDTDWDELRTVFPYTKWSYTESDTKLSMTILDAEAKLLIAEKKSMDLFIIAGINYQRTFHDIYSLDGWQMLLNPISNIYDSTIYFDTFHNVKVGTYEQKVTQFKLGLQSDIHLSQAFSSQLKVAFAPISFKDVDDHILRGKLSDGKGNGNGILAGFNLKYSFSNNNLSFIQLSSSYNRFSSDGTQSQAWYEAEGSIEAGTIYHGIPHTVRTKLYTIGLQIGFAL